MSVCPNVTGVCSSPQFINPQYSTGSIVFYTYINSKMFIYLYTCIISITIYGFVHEVRTISKNEVIPQRNNAFLIFCLKLMTSQGILLTEPLSNCQTKSNIGASELKIFCTCDVIVWCPPIFLGNKCDMKMLKTLNIILKVRMSFKF